MCGVLGIVAKRFSPLSLEALRYVLGHRGPDGADLKDVELGCKKAVFGHVRLSILDLSDAGTQPMTSSDGRWLITYNGEIYNHADLRAELGGSFVSDCDTETLVEALSRWGIKKTLRRLNGIFAFAALDREENKLYIVRDRFGVKPIYYQNVADGVAFSSEVRGLKLLTGCSYDVDRAGLGMFLSYRYTPSPYTLWSGVSRVEPGHVVTYDIISGQLEVEHFVPPPPMVRFQGSENCAVSRYIELLTEAVQNQLLSDVPVGVLLSGGIDSALVAALAVKAGAQPTAFTVGFGDDHPECEISYARHTADVLGLKHRVVSLDAESAWEALLPALAHTEEPLGTTSLVPMWYLSALAHQDVSVVLTGQGTDELFGGYRRYQGEILGQCFPRSVLWRPLAAYASSFGHRGDLLSRALHGLTTQNEAQHMAKVHALFTDDECRALGLEPDDKTRLAPLQSWLDWMGTGRGSDPAERMMTADLRMNLADDLLLYGDRISMAHSVEARVPMLDNHVVDFVESLPRHLRLRWRKSKYLHRKAAKALLPRTIIERPKLGFQVPVGSWARREWHDRIEERLFSKKDLGGLVEIRAVREIWQQHQSGRRDRTRQIFALLALSFWAETWKGST